MEKWREDRYLDRKRKEQEYAEAISGLKNNNIFVQYCQYYCQINISTYDDI